MTGNVLTREQLKEGAEVVIVGPWMPNDLSLRPRGKIKAWSESRFGGVFVEVERRTTHAEICRGGNCEQCRDHRSANKKITALVTYALTDLVVP